jgi:hypothetical protein
MIVAKAIDLSWPTVKSLLNFRLPGETSVGVETDDVFVSFARLKTSTAKTALKFYRLRAASVID